MRGLFALVLGAWLVATIVFVIAGCLKIAHLVLNRGRKNS